MKHIAFAIAAMAAGLTSAGATSAATFADAATFEDYVSVLVPGHELVLFETFDESSETFLGMTNLPFRFRGGTVFLTEPGTGANSDVLTIRRDPINGGIDILFWSDPAMVPPSDILPRQMTLTETGGIQDVSSFFGPGISVQVGSDIDMPIPEPATWAMMLVGVAGVGWLMRKARGRRAALAS